MKGVVTVSERLNSMQEVRWKLTRQDSFGTDLPLA
jgi:hypothetical protein